MTVASLFAGPVATAPARVRNRGGRPTVVNDPEHVGLRAYALAALRAGEPRKRIAASLGIDRKTLWRWENGKLGPRASA